MRANILAMNGNEIKGAAAHYNVRLGALADAARIERARLYRVVEGRAAVRPGEIVALSDALASLAAERNRQGQ